MRATLPPSRIGVFGKIGSVLAKFLDDARRSPGFAQYHGIQMHFTEERGLVSHSVGLTRRRFSRPAAELFLANAQSAPAVVVLPVCSPMTAQTKSPTTTATEPVAEVVAVMAAPTAFEAAKSHGLSGETRIENIVRHHQLPWLMEASAKSRLI
jgi:hypothetical protein